MARQCSRAPVAALRYRMLWIKTFHLLGVISWLAGIFYLPRIFVHYVEGAAANEDVRRLVIMARRLYGFMTIMAIAALGLGTWLWLGYGYSGRWLDIKLVFVAGLIGYHLACRALMMRMQRGKSLPTGLQLRFLNEGALLLIVPILILAVVKPS
jgi:protoporphyrinogen IX oxidase